MIENCKFAFKSVKEKHEWQNLKRFLKDLDESLLPVSIKIEHLENIARVKRHGYSLRSTTTPNEYELTKEKD